MTTLFCGVTTCGEIQKIFRIFLSEVPVIEKHLYFQHVIIDKSL